MRAERYVVKGRILTMTGPKDAADWMLVERGVVAGTGRAEPPPETAELPALSFPTGALLPALHDAHVHLLSTGLMQTTPDLSVAECMAELFALLSDAVASFEGDLLRAHSFDPDLLPDGRYPTSSELDAISRETPIFVKRRDGHSSVVNAAAMELLDVSLDDPGVEKADGRPTGVLRARAHTRAATRAGELLTDAERVEAFHAAARVAASRGVGVVHSLVGAADPGDRDGDIDLLVETAHELPIDVVVYPQTLNVEHVVGLGLPRIGGCILLDGSFSSGTAALDEPYADSGGRGELYFTDDELTGFMRRAHERGLQIAVHALGERAISQALRSYRAATGREAGDSRHRIEHCELTKAAHIADMREMGVSACVQPTFEYLWGGEGGMYEKRLGQERARRSNPFRTMLDGGLRLAGGSDSYVTPLDSRLGIHAAVNRPNVSERLPVFEAISLFTRDAAWFSFDEGRRGTLEPGKEADFVVLGEDPFEADASRLKDIEVVDLYMRGERVEAEV